VLYATFTDWDGSKKDTTTDTTTVMDSPYPFNNEFYLKLNLATGKSSGWCENISDNTDWDNAVMSIDYVRVYKKTDASYTYSQDAYTSTKYPQGPVWYAQIQGTEEGTWENLSTYENNTWSQDGVSITKNSITANEKDAAIAFVAPEDGYVTLHLEKEAVSDGDFTLKVAKGTYSSTECTFGADEETVAQWKVTGQDGTYTTTDATTDLVIQVKADDVLRLEASGNGNVIQNVTPVITYTEEPEVTEPEETETETETTAPETTVPETSSTEETVDTDKTPSTSTPVTEAPTTEAPAAETTATEAAKETVTKVTKPAKPKLTVKKSGKTMRLSWKKVKGADGYEVFMKTGSGKYKRIAVKGKTVTSLKKKGAAGKKYTFRVRAYKKNGTTKVYGSYSAAKTIKISK
jgi:hypothetical protein